MDKRKRCEARDEGHRCTKVTGHGDAHRAFGREWGTRRVEEEAHD